MREYINHRPIHHYWNRKIKRSNKSYDSVSYHKITPNSSSSSSPDSLCSSTTISGFLAMMGPREAMEAPFLGPEGSSVSGSVKKSKTFIRALCFSLVFIMFITILCLTIGGRFDWLLSGEGGGRMIEFANPEVVESDRGVVAADDGRCSEIGASMLRRGGHAVDAAVATTLCLGVVNAMSSGIGGGSFLLVRSSSDSKTTAFDMRETAPLAATEDMYADNPDAKYSGALAMGVPGELAGLHEAWSIYGRLDWKTLFDPAIKLARDGFVVAPTLGSHISRKYEMILADPGLHQVYAPEGKLLRPGDTCYNPQLALTLKEVAEKGPGAFYNGSIGEKLVNDVKEAGGILTMEDLRSYKVEVTEAEAADAMGYTFFGMPPPSSGTLGLALVLNILESYGTSDAARGPLGVHRLIEALKHMFSIRMNLGDPDYVNISNYTSEMLSESFARGIREKILDNTTFPPEYYLYRWSQLYDHGTSHFCIVDADRNAVSMTTTVNFPFGGGVLSPSTGIVLNNEMGDFSTPTEITPDMLPPSPANFIRPNKKPLSSMTPLIVTKDNQVVGVLGGSGGMSIIPAVTQVFLNHFVLGMEPVAAVQQPRVYHKLIPNVVMYENWTCVDGKHIELDEEKKLFLTERNHQVEPQNSGAIVNLIVQSPGNPNDFGRKIGKVADNSPTIYGTLTAVSDPRKDGRPAAV